MFLVTSLIVVIFGLLLHVLAVVLVSRVKQTTRKSFAENLFVIVPNVLLNAAIIFLITFYSTILPPRLEYNRETIQTRQDAEKRIENLESYTREVNIYLESERRQMFMLIAGLGFLYAIPLFALALALAKPKKSKIEQNTVEELK